MDQDQKPRVVSTAVVYRNPRFRVHRDKLQWPKKGPEGKFHKVDYFVIEGPPFVIVIAIRNGEIALVQQYRHTVEEVTTELPKGGIEKGETPQEAAERELLEEVGCSTERLELLANLACSIGNTRKRCYVFIAHDPVAASAVGQKDATEDDLRCIWVPVDEFRAKIRAGEIDDQDSLAAWGVYRERAE